MKKSPAKYTHDFFKEMRNEFWRARARYISYYDKLPIDEKAILFESQNSTKLDGNIFYLLKYIASDKRYSGMKLYVSSWGRYKKEINNLLDNYGIENVQIITYASDDYVRILASAKFLFTDATFPNYFIKRKEQVYLNTWHGTPLKAMGRSIHNDVNFGNVQKNLIEADLLLYPNEFTQEKMVEDFMLKDLTKSAKTVLAGYPRNEVFFDKARAADVRKELELENKRIYAYMPTWRGTVTSIGSSKADAYMLYYLCELDKLLTDDEIMFVNIHPMATHAKAGITTGGMKHIRMFPEGYETYDFLNCADVLVTDYSSVFFDFECTRKKIVLFAFDREDYLADRGMYLSLDDLPFPKVYDHKQLLSELRNKSIDYDDNAFYDKFCRYDNASASKLLSDFTVFGDKNGLEAKTIVGNGKENVLIYAGNLAKNGLTASLKSLLSNIDLDKRNYYVSFCQHKAKNNGDQLKDFDPRVRFCSVAWTETYSLKDRVPRVLYNKNLMSAKRYSSKIDKRIKQNIERSYGHVKFDWVIQFCGYENDLIMLYSKFNCKRTIFVHSNMLDEIKTRKTQRKDVLKYAYRNYDKVAVVSDGLIEPTAKISGTKDNIVVVRNTIDTVNILRKAQMEPKLDDYTVCSIAEDKLYGILSSDDPKFISVGRFSPEKGHNRLVGAFNDFCKKHKNARLLIMGGLSRGNAYDELLARVNELGLENNVILLLNVSNPYPIIKACNYFILSSFYEGLPMVFFEADLLGLPIASTDVQGPHNFLTQYGGTLVENSEEGVYDGLCKLYSGEAKCLGIDYDAYNRECVNEFESLFR
ncbi:MAG: CDP-glycerol glycerophosphotransferase family protein [Ruminococcus sp.]|nr:CDP-glycerol glycerophosphotransferase family protein [Ruminococcus sp.]MBR6967122.1 CDP-glycerol glycerophosphotransferase family protein [Ruminococcus sp.]